MSNKKLDRKLDNLFGEIKKAEAELEEVAPAPAPAPAAKKPAKAKPAPPEASKQAPPKPAPRSKKAGAKPKELTTASPAAQASGLLESSNSLALPITQGETWQVLELVDEEREGWLDEEKALARQVVDQLTLALQNAYLFQQTERQNRNLAVLNEMGRELTTQTTIQGISETVYKYTGQLMDVASFFIAIFNEETDELSFPVVTVDSQRISFNSRRIGRGLTDYIIRNRVPLLLNNNIPERMQELGLEFIAIGNNKAPLSWLGVPLLVSDKILGAIVVQSVEQAYLYNTAEQDLLSSIAYQTAIALESANLFQQTQQQNQELALLNDMAVELSTLSNVEGIANIVYRYTGQLMDVTDFFVALYDAPTNRMSFPLVYFDGEKTSVPDTEIAEGLSAWVIHNRRTLFLPDNVEQRARDMGIKTLSIGDDAPALCWLGVPMILGQEVLGLISVQSAVSARLYNQRHADLLQAIAGQSAIAIQNSQLYEQEQYRRRVADTLSEMARIASSTLEFENVTKNLLDQLPKLLSFHTASIQFVDEAGNRTQAGGVSLHQERQSDLQHPENVFLRPVDEDPLISEIVRGKKPVIIQDTHNDQRWDVLPETEHIRSWLGAPLIVGNNVIGILILDDESPHTYTEESIPLAESFCAQAAVAIQNARLFAETEAAAANFRNLIENAPEAIIVVNVETGLFEDPNENAALLYGLPIPELIKVGPAQMSPPTQPDGRPSTEGAMEKIQLAMQGETPIFEWDHINGKGELIPCEIHLSRMPGDKPRVRATVIDITERKKAQEALRKSEEALRRQNEYLATATEVSRLVSSTLDLPTLFSRAVNLIQSSFGYYHVAVFTLDDAGYTAIVREATGNAGEQMRENRHSLVVGSKSVIGYVTSSGETLVINNTALDPMHKNNPLLPETRAEAAIPLRIGQRIIGALDIQSRDVAAFQASDITVLETLADQISIAINNAELYEISQQAVEQMRETDRIKTQFLANMSHELRTPLNSIIGFSRVILKGIDGPINEQQQQDLTAIYNSGQHLLGLINDILDLSKIEAGKMELSTDELNVADTINSVMSTAIGLVKDKPIRLEKNISADVVSIRADAMRVRQILLNLMSNAAKFTEEGSITVSAENNKTADGMLEVLISVTDTGPGISPEDQGKLFQAFSQVDSSPTRASGGTGLGLSICRRLVELHGGRIGIHSVVGKGSTFYFTIPAYQQPKATLANSNGKIIACIDDDTQITGLYERYLQPQGYQVVALTNPITAKDRVKELKPYAITLDIMMPGMDGWSLLEQLKNDPETREIPVIICSIVEEEEKGFSLGASDYLVKPIMEEDISRSLQRLNGDGSIKRVLVVDDSADDMKLMEKIVSNDGRYQVELAEGGNQGWEKISSTPHPQAVILDLFMPDLTGFEILERMRTSPELREIPVIVVSGAELTAEQKKHLENLGKRLLQKAMLSEKELFGMLEKTLKRIEQPE